MLLPLFALFLAPQEILDQPRTFPGEELLAAADLEGDGDQDLLQHLGGGSVRWLRNDGGGAFVPGPARALAAGVDVRADDLVVADLDGDGLADLALRSTTIGAELVLHRGLPGDALGPAETTAVAGLSALAVGDADGDGGRDLLCASAGLVRWFRLAPAGWTAGPGFGIAGTVRDFALADFDGDGDDDGAVSFAGSSTIELVATVGGVATGAGTLVAPTSAAPELELITGDFDSDGNADLVAGDAATEPVAWVVALGDGALGFTVGSSATYIDVLDAGSAHALDVDGDGDDDVVVGRGPTAGFPAAHSLVFLEATGGVLSLALDAPLFRASSPLVPVRLAIGDLDGDGRPDVLADEALVFGRGAFEPWWSIDLPSLTRALLVDLEGDGDPDFYLENLRNQGDGTFVSAGPPLPNPPTGESWDGSDLVIGDFDGDGLTDAIAVSTCYGCGPFGTNLYTSHLLLGDGLGGYAFAGYTVPGGNGRPVDVDGDGDLDLLGIDTNWLENRLPLPFQLHPPLVTTDRLQDFADFEGDGDLDLWCRGNAIDGSAPTLFVALGLGTYVPLPLPVPGHGQLMAVDLDGDGDLDTVYKESDGDFHLVETTPLGFGAELTLATEAVLGFDVADFDADGRPDLATFEPYSLRGMYRARFLLTGGQPFPVYLPEREYILPFGAEDVADVDGDGDADIVGPVVLRSLANSPPTGARRFQYGAGSAGTGGAVPLLGATAPLVPGATVELRLRQGLGGATAFLGVGSTPGSFLDVPFAGNTLLLGDLTLFDVRTLDGTPGGTGAGGFDLPFTVGPVFAGMTSFAQVFVLDPGAPNGALAGSNGLELRFGQ